jgi:hypothetical protein
MIVLTGRHMCVFRSTVNFRAIGGHKKSKNLQSLGDKITATKKKIHKIGKKVSTLSNRSIPKAVRTLVQGGEVPPIPCLVKIFETASHRQKPDDTDEKKHGESIGATFMAKTRRNQKL